MKEQTPTLLHIAQSGDLSQLNTYITKRYAINMDFFSTLNPKLYNEIQTKPSQYTLYCKDNNLNIIDIQNNTFVYPVENAKHTMIEQNLSLSKNPLNNPAFSLYTNHLALHKLDSQKIPLTAHICNPMIELMQNEFSGSNRFHLPNNFLPSSTFFGLLGGMFLQFLLEKGYFFHSLLLFEEDIDLFRISLYFVNYPLLFESVSDRSCYLFVKDLLHKEFVQNYFTQRRITNNFLRLELQLYDSPKIEAVRDNVAQAYAMNSRGWGSFDDEMIGVKNTFCNLSKSEILPYPILHLPQRVNVPICVVGNGASLDSLLPFIKANMDRMIIFSCGTALKPLKNAGIEPDFQIEIERIDYLKGVLESAPLGDTTLLCGNMVQPSALSLAKEAYMFMRGGSASAYFGRAKSVVEFAAPYVGNAGFALACLLSEEVLICGLDCGYIKGRTKHAKGSFYGDEQSEIPKNAYAVQGNAECEVYADALFSLSAAMMSRAIEVFAPRLVLNLGEGAYIRGSRSIRADEFDLAKVDKAKAIAELKGYMCKDKHKVLSSTDSHISEVKAYKEAILQAMKVSVRGKRELFERIDKIQALSLKKVAEQPFVGVLFEGSISHILHSIMLCALHIPNDDIALFYARCVELVESGLNKMVMSYTLLATTHTS